MRVFEFTESAIVTVNRTLNPKIWKGDRLDPQVASKLKDIAEAFEEFIGVEIDVVDYTVTGSDIPLIRQW